MNGAKEAGTNKLELTKTSKDKKEPWWNWRLEGKLKELNRDLDFVNTLLDKKILRSIKIGLKENTTTKEKNLIL